MLGERCNPRERVLVSDPAGKAEGRGFAVERGGVGGFVIDQVGLDVELVLSKGWLDADADRGGVRRVVLIASVAERDIARIHAIHRGEQALP